MFLFNHLVAIHEAGTHLGLAMMQPTLLYGFFIFLSIFSYTSLMDRRIASVFWESLRLILGLFIMATWDGWFTLSFTLPVSSPYIIGYLWVSYAISFFFVAFDFLNDSSDGPLQKYRKVLKNATDIGSINRGFRVRNQAVYIYERSKKGLSNFYPKRKFHSDGIHTDPLDLWELTVFRQEQTCIEIISFQNYPS